MKQKGNAALLGVLVAILVLGGAIGFFSYTNNQTVLEITEQSKGVKTVEVANTVENTTNWKTYRNDEFGFEFRYPDEINNNPVSVESGSRKNIFTLYESEMLYGDPVEGKAGSVIQPFLENDITFSVSFLDDYEYPEPAKTNNSLTVGVDLGNLGGFVYDPNIKKWRDRSDVNKILTWESLFSYLTSSSLSHLSLVETASKQIAYSYYGGIPSLEGYRIFNIEKGVYINFLHTFAFTDETKNDVELINVEIRKALKDIIGTLKFY